MRLKHLAPKASFPPPPAASRTDVPILTNPDLESLIIYITYQRACARFFHSFRARPAGRFAKQQHLRNLQHTCSRFSDTFAPCRRISRNFLFTLFFFPYCIFTRHGWVARLPQVTLDAHSSSSIGVLGFAIGSLRPTNPPGPEFSSPARVSVQHRANRTYGC